MVTHIRNLCTDGGEISASSFGRFIPRYPQDSISSTGFGGEEGYMTDKENGVYNNK